jgi:hypothetical protein
MADKYKEYLAARVLAESRPVSWLSYPVGFHELNEQL